MDWILCIDYSSFIMAVVLVLAFALTAITTACDVAHMAIMVLADDIDDCFTVRRSTNRASRCCCRL